MVSLPIRTITLAGPLAANMPLTLVTPISFTFSDGVQTLTDMTAGFSNFQFATGPSVEITAWFIDIQLYSAPTNTTGEIHTENYNGGAFDEGNLGGHLGFGYSYVAGAWVVTGESVPDAGSTLSLMTLTLMALGVAARQFKRAAA